LRQADDGPRVTELGQHAPDHLGVGHEPTLGTRTAARPPAWRGGRRGARHGEPGTRRGEPGTTHSEPGTTHGEPGTTHGEHRARPASGVRARPSRPPALSPGWRTPSRTRP